MYFENYKTLMKETGKGKKEKKKEKYFRHVYWKTQCC